MLPDRRQGGGGAPYNVEQYICIGRDVALLDSKRFDAMQAGEWETVVVGVRGGGGGR